MVKMVTTKQQSGLFKQNSAVCPSRSNSWFCFTRTLKTWWLSSNLLLHKLNWERNRCGQEHSRDMGSKYPKCLQSGISGQPYSLIPYPESSEQLIYTTNTVERFKPQLRKWLKTRQTFPSESNSFFWKCCICILRVSSQKSVETRADSYCESIPSLSYFEKRAISRGGGKHL